jgi:hypothetical protein
MPATLIPATNRSFLTHYFKYWGAPTTNLSMGTLGSVTYPTQPTSASITFGTGYLTTGTYLFSLRVNTFNSAKGTCSITYPWSETTNSGNGWIIGNNKQVATGYYSYITVTATAIYPNTFSGWYSSNGTLLTYSATVNVAYNNGYDDWYAVWSGDTFILYKLYTITLTPFSDWNSLINNNTWSLNKSIYGANADFSTNTNYYTAGPIYNSIVYNETSFSTVFIGNSTNYQYSITYNSKRYLSIISIDSTGHVLSLYDIDTEAPRNVAYSNLTSTTVRVTWTYPLSQVSGLTDTYKGTSAFIGYKVYKWVSGSGFVLVVTVSGSTFLYDVTGLSSNTAQTILIRAYNTTQESGLYGQSTSIVYFTTPP